MPRGADCGDGVDAGVVLVVAVLLPFSRLDDVRGDGGERGAEAKLAVGGEGQAEEVAVAVEDLSGEADAVQQRVVWGGRTTPEKSRAIPRETFRRINRIKWRFMSRASQASRRLILSQDVADASQASRAAALRTGSHLASVTVR